MRASRNLCSPDERPIAIGGSGHVELERPSFTATFRTVRFLRLAQPDPAVCQDSSKPAASVAAHRAVAVSQGRNLAVSLGGHLQGPVDALDFADGACRDLLK